MGFIRKKLDANKMYYYCKLETAVEYILKNNQILLNPMINTNDPRENKDFVFSGMDKPDDVKLEDLRPIVSKIIREECKISCFSKDYNNINGCLLSNMWAHYGGNHRGICIEININDFLIENENLLSNGKLGNIIYDKNGRRTIPLQPTINYPKLNELGLHEYISNDLKNLYYNYFYFTKSEVWANESEVRYIYFSKNSEHEYCSIKNSMEAIYLGIDLNDVYIPTIQNLINGKPMYKIDCLAENLMIKKID